MVQIVEDTLIAERYRVKKKLGEGGCGVVYLTVDENVGVKERHVVLKMLHPFLTDNQEILQRFQNELLITETFSHENIVRVGSFERREETYFITMEYVDGGTLSEQIEREGDGFKIARIVEIATDIAQALQYAHKKGIIHRDVKPENMLLNAHGEVKVADFGIARPVENYNGLTAQDDFVGTRTYMSPEQLLASPDIDHRTDIYSFGIMLYEMLSGKPPFVADSEYVVSNMHCQKELPNIHETRPDTPPWLKHLIEKCCEKNPDRRFPSFQEILEILQFQRGDARFKLYIDRRSVFLRRLMQAACIALFMIYLLFPLKGVIGSGYIGQIHEPRMMDYWFSLRDFAYTASVPKDVRVVFLDQDTYKQLGANTLMPFPRRYMIQLFRTLDELGTKTIVLDMLIADNLLGHQTDEAYNEALKETELLSDALTLTPTYLARARVHHYSDSKRAEGTHTIEQLRSAEIFRGKAHGEFYANLMSTQGVIRNFYHGDRYFYTETPMAKVFYNDDVEGRDQPTIRDYVNYYGPPGTLRNLSISQVLQGDYPEGYFEESYVFIGKKPDPTSESDLFYTPFRVKTPGVEIHATMFANILEKNWIQRMDRRYEIFILFFLTLLLSFVLLVSPPRRGLKVFFYTLLLSLSLSYVMFLVGIYVPGFLALPFVLGILYLLSHIHLVQKLYSYLRKVGFDESFR